MVHSRAGHGAHGDRSEDLRAQPVPAVARREEPVCGGWQQPCERVVPEPDLDHHGVVLEVLRLSGGSVPEGGALMDRRELIKIAGAAALTARVAHGAPRFFTPEEFALADELTEMIIPSDEHSPGARAAGVAAYIDARLAESLEPEQGQTWRDGLKLVDAMSVQLNG